MPVKSKITSLEALRGFAVLSVAFGHFGHNFANGSVLPDFFGFLWSYGNIGVQVFFVISGFIIPYSLYKSKYAINDYFRFLYKRTLRLHPPYLAALIITLIISGVSYKLRHLPNPETLKSILLSIFYIHTPADNPVFWTLKIEAEYYIFIGLFYTVFTRNSKVLVLLLTSSLLIISQTVLIEYIGLFKYIIFFLIGIVGYLIYTSNGNKLLNYLALLVLIIFSFCFYKFAAAITSSATIMIILYFRKPVHSILEFPGRISYSIYLLHFVIGVKLINLLQRSIAPYYQWTLFILATLVCFLIAWIFWKYIEKPSADLSNKVKYGNKKTKSLTHSLEI